MSRARRFRVWGRAATLAVLTWGAAALAAPADGYTVVRVDTTRQDLRLFWRDAQGQPWRRLSRLAEAQAGQGRRLAFGMNAGMYHADLSPVGLLVLDGREVAPLNLAGGDGNFFLKPNGVFLLGPSGPKVVDAVDYPTVSAGVRWATQSGPMLVKDGRIHPQFRPDSASRYIRNGVCAQGSVAVFVISERPVSLFDLAQFFRDDLQCRDALYLDGAVSTLYAPAQGRTGQVKDLGPLLGVLE